MKVCQEKAPNLGSIVKKLSGIYTKTNSPAKHFLCSIQHFCIVDSDM